MFIGVVIWTLFTSAMSFNQYTYEDCKKLKFEPKACVISKGIDKVAEKTKGSH